MTTAASPRPSISDPVGGFAASESKYGDEGITAADVSRGEDEGRRGGSAGTCRFRLTRERTLEHIIKTKAESVADGTWQESRARTQNALSDPVPQVMVREEMSCCPIWMKQLSFMLTSISMRAGGASFAPDTKETFTE